MKKIALSILFLIMFFGCSGITIGEKYSNYIGQWKSEDSLLSISPKGKVHYFTTINGRPVGMTGNAVIVNEDKIVFVIIVVPKKLNITKSITKNNDSLTMEIDNVDFIKISDKPYKSLADRL